MGQLPTTIGETIANASGITIHAADSNRFAPHAHFAAPEAEAPKESRPPMDGLPAPIALLPDTNFVPLEYQLHKHSQVCKSCGATHSWVQAYAFNQAAPRWGMGKQFSHLVPVTKFSYNIPVKVLLAKGTEVPACFACQCVDLSNLPDGKAERDRLRCVAVAQAAATHAARKAAEEAAKTEKQALKEAAKPLTKRSTLAIDDLL